MGINNEQEECRALHFSIIECVGEAYKTIPPALLPLKEGTYKMPGSLGLRPECGGDGGGNENKASRE